MAFLTNADIDELLNSKKLQIEPYSHKCLTPIGYDLRVGKSGTSIRRGPCNIEMDDLEISSGDTVLIKTREILKMPEDKSISGIILSKVSLVSKGLSHIATTIDADWEGDLLITITNHSRNKIKLGYEDELCTAVFFANKQNATIPSGKDPGRDKIYQRKLYKANRKAKKEKKLKSIAYLLIIPICFIIGLVFFKDNLGFPGITTLGIGIATALLSFDK